MKTVQQQPKFEVPYNGDMSILTIYKQYHEHITCVYGKANDNYPEGRNTKHLRSITLSDIKDVINSLNVSNIPFNYILNGNNHSNKEYDKTYRKTFIEFVRQLKGFGCNQITLSNVFLIELIRNEMPEMDIHVSVISEIDNLTRIKHLAKLGVKNIVLSKTLLKNFNGLANIHKYKPENVELILLANDPCLHHCAYTQYHNQSLSFFTAQGGDFVNFCRLHCTNDFASDIRKVISASFIRPEDIATYKGIGFLVFKLTDRKQSTSWLENTIKAYVDGRYDGNLSDIMSPWSSYNEQYPFPETLKTLKSNADLVNNRINLRFSPQINNTLLNGYLDYWKQNKPNGCANENCDNCNYCLQIAQKTCTVDQVWLDTIMNNTKMATKFALHV